MNHVMIQMFFRGVNLFFVLYLLGYSTFLFLSVMVGALTLYQKRKEVKLNNVRDDLSYVPVSIIVPAYNEELTVVDTVLSLLALDYTTYEIVVVNDGSSDKTEEELIRAFDLKPLRRPIRKLISCQPETGIYVTMNQKVPVTLVSKKNGGKADALNMGINVAKNPYFICMDADSMLQYDSLREIVRLVLENDQVIAVGGVVRPSNGVVLERGRVISYDLPKNILACMQVLEYDRSFLASRILLDKFNGSLIISGAFGLFKKDIVVACGGYNRNTVGEDMELVVRLHEFCANHNRPYLIRYAVNAVCWSQAPERLKDLRKQRIRWHRGLYQSLTMHKSLFANIKFGAVSWISYFYFLVYELLSPYIELFGLATMAFAYWMDLLNVPFAILFFLIYAVFGATMSLTAFFSRIQTVDLRLSVSDVLKAIMLCLFEITVLRFILALARMTALNPFKRKNYSWGKIERTKNQFSS